MTSQPLTIQVEIELVRKTGVTSSPYITAYISTLMHFIDSLGLPNITYGTYEALFMGINVLGGRAERNQRFTEWLQNNLKNHLDAIVAEFGFPMTFGTTEYYDLNKTFKEACELLQLVPFELYVVPTVTQKVTGNRNISVRSMSGGIIVSGDNCTVGNGSDLHIGDNIQINTGGGDYASGSINKVRF